MSIGDGRSHSRGRNDEFCNIVDSVFTQARYCVHAELRPRTSKESLVRLVSKHQIKTTDINHATIFFLLLFAEESYASPSSIVGAVLPRDAVSCYFMENNAERHKSCS